MSGETFCFLENGLLSIFQLCASSNLLFFVRAADRPTTNFLGMYCYFPVIRLVNFVRVAPGYSSRTVTRPFLEMVSLGMTQEAFHKQLGFEPRCMCF